MLYNIEHTTALIWKDLAKDVDAITRIESVGNNRIHNFKDLGIDLFHRLYTSDRNIQIPLPETQWQAKLHNAFTVARDWDELERKCKGNKRLAIVATAHILDYILSDIIYTFYGDREIEQLRDQVAQARKLGLSSLANNLSERIKKTQDDYEKYAKDLSVDHYPKIAVTQALKAITSTLTPGNGWDDLPGVHNAKSLAAQVEATQAYSKSRAQKVIVQLGRMSKVLGKGKKTSAKSSKNGIEFGREVPDLLPDEWLKPQQQFLLEYTEEKLVQYSKSKVSTDKGPIIVLLDKSGSMDYACLDGSKETYDIWAKSFLLFIAKTARKENRDIYCIVFDEQINKSLDLKKAKAIEVAELLNTTPSGGTNWCKAIDKAINILSGKDVKAGKFKASDILLITDGTQKISDSYQQQLQQQKKLLKFKIQGILVYKATNIEALEIATQQLSVVADNVTNVSGLLDEGKLSSIVDSL